MWGMKPWICAVVLVLAGTVQGWSGTLADAVDGSLVRLKDGKLENVAKGSLADKKIIAFYYSAHWCPPCRAFTPDLVAEYAELSKKYPQFELIFVSSDQDENAMKEYMEWGKMAWPAVAYGKDEKIELVNKLRAEGIPYLVVVDENGKVIADKGSEDWISPRKILDKLKEVLAKS